MQITNFSHCQLGVIKDPENPSGRILQISEMLPIEIPGMPPMPLRVYQLAMTEEIAREIGNMLIAPSLQVAQTFQMPNRNGNGPH